MGKPTARECAVFVAKQLRAALPGQGHYVAYADRIDDLIREYDALKDERFRARAAAFRAGFKGGDLAEIIESMAQGQTLRNTNKVATPRENT